MSNGLDDDKLQESVNAVLGIMGFSVVPDVTSGSLSIDNSTTSNPEIFMTNLAGGATISKSFPLYFEGGIAYSRYNPKYVVGDDSNETTFKLKWNSVLLSSGVGWDFPIGVKLLKRPLRYVLEGAHTTYLGDQRGILGFNNLSSIGVGIELGSSDYNVIVTRTRLVGRYMFGHNVSGFTIGLAMSF